MEYYSNCLIEALRAKIKDPYGVKLRCLPAKQNEVFIPHIMWEDSKHTYDFYTGEKLNPVQILWHRGSIRVSELGYYDRAIETMRRYKERRKHRKKS